jgi:hypothetical protein
MRGVYSKVKSIEEDGIEDVYCINVPKTGNFIANGIVVKNCDALRYACVSAFPNGDFGSPDENLTIDQLRRKVYQEDMGYGFMNASSSGYF